MVRRHRLVSNPGASELLFPIKNGGQVERVHSACLRSRHQSRLLEEVQAVAGRVSGCAGVEQLRVPCLPSACFPLTTRERSGCRRPTQDPMPASFMTGSGEIFPDRRTGSASVLTGLGERVIQAIGTLGDRGISPAKRAKSTPFLRIARTALPASLLPRRPCSPPQCQGLSVTDWVE